MNTLRSVIALLLLAPVIASAQIFCPPAPQCEYLPPPTSQTLTVDQYGAMPDLAGANWTASGPGYTVGVFSGALSGVGPSNPIPYGGEASLSFADGTDGYTSFTLTVDGVKWGIAPAGGFAYAEFDADALSPITHAGSYFASYNMQGFFYGQPANEITDCNQSPGCTSWVFGGAGTGVIHVSDLPGQPNTFYVTGMTSPVPEPSTASLLLLGFAGVAVIWRRRGLGRRRPAASAPPSLALFRRPRWREG